MTDKLKQEQIDLRSALRKEFRPLNLMVRLFSKAKDGKSAQFSLYVDVRLIFNRLDAVVGPTNWRLLYQWTGDVVSCTLSIFDGEKHIWVDRMAHHALEKSDDSAFNKSLADQIKSAETHAARRAAMEWGIGRYLYYAAQVVTESGFLYIPIEGSQITKDTTVVVRTPDWTETRVYDGWGNVTTRTAVENKEKA